MIDWAAARVDHVIHYELTYADIAEKYHSYPSTILKRAAREKWTEQRKMAGKRRVEEKAREKAVYSQSEKLARCNARHLTSPKTRRRGGRAAQVCT